MSNNEKFIDISNLSKKIGLINKKNGKPLTHTLRFWETKFSEIKPTILQGRRFYNKKNQEIVELINYLLKNQGLTISGAKKILKKKINNLDEYRASSIKHEYIKKKIKDKSLNLLERINKLKT